MKSMTGFGHAEGEGTIGFYRISIKSFNHRFSDINLRLPRELCVWEENLISYLIQRTKPCHCDCVFRRKTALAITLFKFIPRCPYYDTFFAFRRTGVHPPLFN